MDSFNDWSQPRQKQKLELIRLGELLSEPIPDRQWVVDGLLLNGGFSLLCGKPKSGKSSLSRCLALSVARGQPFLDRKVERGPVLLLALEDHRTMLQEAFRKLGSNGEEQILIHVGSIPGNPIRQLEMLIETYRPALVIIDTVFRFTKCFDVNSYTAVLESLTPVADTARQYGVHIMAVHHAGKSERSDSLDSVLGSVAVHGSMDCTMLLSRKPEFRVFESQQRYGVDLPPTMLAFENDTGIVKLGLPVSEIENAKTAEEILDFLSGCDGPVSELEITDAIGRRTQTIRRSLRQLRDSGSVLRQGSGGRGSVYRYSISPCT